MALEMAAVARAKRMSFEHEGGDIGVHKTQGQCLLPATATLLEPDLEALELIVIPEIGAPADEVVELGTGRLGVGRG
jgi:hypothetical protein